MASPVTRLVCDAYREAAKTPLLVSALLDLTSATGLAAVSTRWSQTNLATNTKQAYSKQLLVNTAIMELMHEAAAVAENGVEMATVSGDTSIKVWGHTTLEFSQTSSVTANHRTKATGCTNGGRMQPCRY